VNDRPPRLESTSRPDPKKSLGRANFARVFRELIWPRKGPLTLGLLLIFVNRLSGLVLPGATKFLIDDVVQKRNLELLTPLASAVGAAILLQAGTSFALTQFLSKAAQRLIADLRMKIQRHIGRLPVAYYDANKTGALVSRIMSDVEGIRNLIGTGLVELLGGLLTALVALALLVTINPTLTAATLAFLALFGFLVSRAFAKIRPIFRERNAIHAEVQGRLAESLGGVRVVKGFHAEEREAGAFAAGAMRLYENVRKTLTATSLMSMAGTLLMGSVSLTVLILGSRMIVQGRMSLGDFIAFSLYLGLLIAPVLQIVGIGSQMTEAFAGIDRMHEVLEEVPEDVDPERIHRIGPLVGHVIFEKVCFSYDSQKTILHQIDFSSVPGTVTALVGPSGSGKSTLIGLVAAFAKPAGGRILVDGIDLATVRLDSYRTQLGVVLQDNFLFDGTIRENILFGKPGADDPALREAARIAGVDEFTSRLDQGLDTVIGERGVKLSGGQRQRVAIARAILANPRILILDEATSSLDSESEAWIQQGLAALMRGRTTFVIAHRLSTIRGADQILVLEEGKITERGTHGQLLELRGRYFDLYTRQAGLEGNRFINPGESEKEDATPTEWVPPARPDLAPDYPPLARFSSRKRRL